MQAGAKSGTRGGASLPAPAGDRVCGFATSGVFAVIRGSLRLLGSLQNRGNKTGADGVNIVGGVGGVHGDVVGRNDRDDPAATPGKLIRFTWRPPLIRRAFCVSVPSSVLFRVGVPRGR